MRSSYQKKAHTLYSFENVPHPTDTLFLFAITDEYLHRPKPYMQAFR